LKRFWQAWWNECQVQSWIGVNRYSYQRFIIWRFLKIISAFTRIFNFGALLIRPGQDEQLLAIRGEVAFPFVTNNNGCI